MLRIGLIGLGRHGMRYVHHLLEPSSVARVVAVCRRDTVKGEAVAKAHGLRFYSDFGDLIADPTVDAVVIVTPPVHTKAICLKTIQAGKPVLIEKPLAVTAADAHLMATAAETAGVPLMTGHTLRFDEVVQMLKRSRSLAGSPQYLVLTNRIEPRSELRRSPADYGGRGVLLEVGIHLIDLVRFLTEQEVVEVWCETDRVEGPESRAYARLLTEKGLTCLLDVSRVTAGRMGRAEISGPSVRATRSRSRSRTVVISASG
jgi:predicted dehydrogenase